MGSGLQKPELAPSLSGNLTSVLSQPSEPLDIQIAENTKPKSSEAFVVDSEEYFDIICVPCNREGATREAHGYCCQCQEHLCESCCKHHKKATLSLQHEILDKDIMPFTQRMTTASQHLSRDEQQVLPVSITSYTTITPTSRGQINVRTSEDTNTCYITGMTVLSPDRLVLTDWTNNSIKLVNIKCNTVMSQLSFHKPWEITTVTKTQVAVTVPGQKHVQFITVSDQLILSHIIQTNGKSYGICCYEDKLLVTFKFPSKLDILDLKGRVIASVEKDSSCSDIFNSPTYVKADTSNIFVSDWKQVVMLNWRGEVIGRIGELNSPEGLSLLHDGSFLVCDRFKDTLYHVSRRSPGKKTVIQNISRPYAICVDECGHKLFISRWDNSSNDDKTNDTILTYTI